VRHDRARAVDPVPGPGRRLNARGAALRFNARMPTPAAACTAIAAALLAACGMAQAPAVNPVTPGFRRDEAGRAVDGQSVRDPARQRVQRIAILPDRTTGRDWGLPYLEAAVEDLNIVRPDAVFTVGDMVQGYTRDRGRWEREVGDYLARVGRLVPAFYPTPGNHDVISGTRSPADRTFAELYRERFGPVYYSVELDLATAIVLFSDEGLGDGKIILGDAQLAWLDGALEAAKARGKPIFLLMHRPLWRSASVGWQERVQPLLERAGADAVIAGHFHALQRDPDVNGVQYHIVGTCGGMIDQHPLAGQLQHLTFVDCTEGGALRVWHQPVGLVLPEDFVTRADQDRVWKLRESKTVRATGLAEPAPGGDPRAAEATVEVRNPIDVPIRITLAPPGVITVPGRAPLWWTAGRAGRGTPGAPAGANGWTSHARADVDNPHTMPLDATAAVEADPAAAEAEVAPGASRTLRIPVRLPEGTAATLPAPQLELYATFIDGKGRTVPVWLPTRLPIRRTVEAASSIDAAAPLPVLAWEYSPYDTREANPQVRIARTDAGELMIDVQVPDDAATAAPQWTEPDAARKGNPHADAVRVIVDRAGGATDLLFEPFTPGASMRQAGGRCEARRDADGRWSARVTLDAAAGEVGAMQVGVADNDDTYHTQWRWLAPGGSAGRWPLSGGGLRATAPGTSP
jgi:hypothetical protein